MFVSFLFSVLVVILNVVHQSSTDKSFLGKKDVMFRHSSKCEGFSGGWNSSLKTFKVSRTKTSVTIYIEAKTPIDEKVKLAVNLAVWSNGGWRPNFYNIEFKDICNMVKTNMIKSFHQLCRDSNVPHTCPLPSGSIFMKNYIVDLSEMKAPTSMLPLGKMKTDVSVFSRNKQVLCFSGVIEVVPGH